MTDWWAKMNHCIKGGEASVKNTAYMVKARNDVYMIVDNDGAEINQYEDNIDDCIKENELSICELQLCAKDIILYLLDAPVSKRPLRKLKETIYLESSILNEPLNKKIYKEDEVFLPDTDTYFYAPVDGVYNISGKYLKEAEDLNEEFKRHQAKESIVNLKEEIQRSERYDSTDVLIDPADFCVQKRVSEHTLDKLIQIVKTIGGKFPKKRYYEIFKLRYIKKLNQAEIAREMKISQVELSKRFVELIKLTRENV
jgi:hypothetical protein